MKGGVFMPKEYCDILLFGAGTVGGLILGILCTLFILKEIQQVSSRERKKRKRKGRHDQNRKKNVRKKKKTKSENIKKKKTPFSERISTLASKTSWSELSCLINKTDPTYNVRRKRKKQDDSYQYIKKLKNQL